MHKDNTNQNDSVYHTNILCAHISLLEKHLYLIETLIQYNPVLILLG